jgi:hypothetical protein
LFAWGATPRPPLWGAPPPTPPCSPLQKFIHADNFIRMDNKVYGRVRALFAAILALSIGALGAAAVLGGGEAVWVRGIIVTVIAAVLILLAKRAFEGSRGAFRRMRIMSVVAPIAIVVIVALPHDGFPIWMKAEQVVVGALFVAVLVTLRRAYR